MTRKNVLVYSYEFYRMYTECWNNKREIISINIAFSRIGVRKTYIIKHIYSYWKASCRALKKKKECNCVKIRALYLLINSELSILGRR